MSNTSTRTVAYMTPPQVAELLAVSAEKIIGWIERGELRGFNVATTTGGRPRWRISQAALDDFLESRSASAPPRSKVPRRNRQDGSVPQWY